MTTFSAADSALGYLYQVRVALLWSLRRARAGTDFLVSLETLDDVTFESLQATGSEPDELLQTKHRRKSEASLADASGDLWKSLRVWFEGRANHTIPSDAALIFKAVEAVAPGLQVILIEHADLNEDWYRDAIVERWRGGKKLVPKNWPRDGGGAAE